MRLIRLSKDRLMVEILDKQDERLLRTSGRNDSIHAEVFDHLTVFVGGVDTTPPAAVALVTEPPPGAFTPSKAFAVVIVPMALCRNANEAASAATICSFSLS